MIPLVDCHQHLMYPKALSYGWASKVPALADRAFTLEDYKSLTSGLGVSGTLFMEVDVDEADRAAEAELIAGLARHEDYHILGLVAATRPEDPRAFDADLERANDLGIVGFRRVLHVVDDGISQSEAFRQSLRKLGPAGKTFDIVVLARQLSLAYELAVACPDTVFILDHCGVPDIAGGVFDPWAAAMGRMAELPNVWCKLSGVLTYTKAGEATLGTVRPYIDHVLDVFGPNRMVWGSDWPVVTINSDLPDWLAMTRTILDGLSIDEANAIANANAARVYGLEVAGSL